MDTDQRKVAIITSLGKKYSGFIDIPNMAFRTTDLLNSSIIYWKNPAEKCHDEFILMHEAQLFIDESSVYKKFDKVQIRLSEIFYFYDDFETIGDEREKTRAATMLKDAQEKPQILTIITRCLAQSFYDISGKFYGLFKKKSRDKFIPLIEAKMFEIYKKQDKWFKKEIKLPYKFICISTDHIESMFIG